LSLAVAIVLLAALVPSCKPTTGTINVVATLDGVPWPTSGTGAVSYALIPVSGANISGTKVPDSFTVAPGSWNCTYVSGGPPAAYFVDVTPSEVQSVTAGGNITFTLRFVTYAAAPVNASIGFISWTINGQLVPPGQYVLRPNDYVDIKYGVNVTGAQGAYLTVKETSWLKFHYAGGVDQSITIHAVNAWAAVQTNPPARKLSQMTTIEGVAAPACTTVKAWECEPVKLDVETEWKLRTGTQYTKSINWLSFPSYADVLFDLPGVVPSGQVIQLTAWSCVDLEGDSNPQDDCSGNSTITIQLVP